MTRVLGKFCPKPILLKRDAWEECNATQRIFERRKTILRSLANTWPRVLTRLVGRSRAIFGLEVGSRCVNRAEEMDWSEPVAELYTKLASRTPRWRGGHGRLSPWKTAPVPSPHVGRCEGKPKATANVTVSEISCCVHGLEESRGRWSSFGIRARKSSADLLVGLN